MARGESVRDRKLVKSGGQRVELSVALSVAGFIRSEGGIYVGPSVIYRFRWYTRYRYTDIDTSLVRARQSRSPSSLSPSFSRCLFAYILLYYWIFLSRSLSLFLYLLGETWFTWGHLRSESGKHLRSWKRNLGLPSGSIAGISSVKVAKKSRNSYKNIHRREDI